LVEYSLYFREREIKNIWELFGDIEVVLDQKIETEKLLVEESRVRGKVEVEFD